MINNNKKKLPKNSVNCAAMPLTLKSPKLEKKSRPVVRLISDCTIEVGEDWDPDEAGCWPWVSPLLDSPNA